MGSSRWSADDWSSYSSAKSTMSAGAIFTSSSLNEDLDPRKFSVRESRDSDANPKSTPLIVGVDVTGSMGILAEHLVKSGLGPLFEEVLNRKPITDPHVMVMGIGDADAGDRAPIQVSQFEADLTIAKQIEKIYIERGGGANDFESYHLAWYCAATRTSIDSFEKRNKKGYLFTVGDEPPAPVMTADSVRRTFGDQIEGNMPIPDLLALVQRTYDVFHVIIEEGSYARHKLGYLKDKWSNILGQNVISLSDHKKLSEAIVSAIEVREGRDHDDVAASWSGDTSVVVSRAISGMVKGAAAATSVTRF